MKALLCATVLLSCGSAHAYSTLEYATVLSSAPVYQRSVTQRCETTPETHVDYSSDGERAVGSIVGGVVGGVLGHQIGGGRGRDVATVAGAIAGTLTGRNLADRPSVSTSYHQTCYDDAHSVLTGYSVVYQFHGRQSTIQMPYDPGTQLEMRVSVEPVIR